MPEKQNPMEALWERLQTTQPEETAQRAAVAYDPVQRAYTVPLCGREIRVLASAKRVEAADGQAGYDATLLCPQYLLMAQDGPLAGEWVDPKRLPYGDFFFRPPHEMPTDKLEEAFGQRVEAFRKAAEAVGGTPEAMGDAAYQFRALPRIPVVVILWAADDEFPARAQFLLDKRADRQLPLDALWVLCRVLAKRLLAAGATE